jgi:alpha-mannosidase
MSLLQRSVVVIPSYAIEDLPTEIGHELSADFLNAWTVLWDPRLLVAINSLPEWKRSDTSSLDLESALVLVPTLCREKVDQPQRERLFVGKCLTIDSDSTPSEEARAALADRILSALVEHGHSVVPSSTYLAQDFYALGYAILQVQILAKKLRYSWNLDWIAFSEQVLLAAKASLAGDAAETERWLQVCFDTLSQERDRYCSQQIHLLDVVLVAESTFGDKLQKQLESSHSLNVLIDNRSLSLIKERHPATWEILCKRLESQEITILGGLDQAIEGNYLVYQDLVEEFRNGRESAKKLGLAPTKVFAQFEPGTGFLFPDLLADFGFEGAIVNAWSGGDSPTKDNAKVRWQSNTDATAIDTIMGHVFDAGSAESFLHFASNLTKQLDYHHVPTKVMAHWPDAYATSMKDLLRVIARSPALGTFVTAAKYFQTTNQPYSTDAFKNHQFKIATPSDGEQRRDLAQRLQHYSRCSVFFQRLKSTAYLWDQVAASSSVDVLRSLQLQELGKEVRKLLSGESSFSDVSLRLQEAKDQLLRSIAESLKIASSNSKTPNGYLIVNDASHAQRVFVNHLPAIVEPQSNRRVLGSFTNQGISQMVVDLPPSGFVKVSARDVRESASNGQTIESRPVVMQSLWKQLIGTKREIADKNWTMVNEYVELQIDPKKGHLRSLFIPGLRGSRMSGMVSLVAGSPSDQRKWQESDFLPLEEVQLRLIESTELRGCIEASAVSTLPNGKKVPLTVRYTLWKGSRWLLIHVAGGNDESHCVWRTAWHNDTASVNVWQQGAKGKLMFPLQATIDVIEVDDVEHKIYLAARGLPIHHRWEARYLVTPLPQSSQGFEFAIGVDWPKPWETAQDVSVEPWTIPVHLAEKAADEGAWLAQSNQPNIALSWDDPSGVTFSWKDEENIRPNALIWVQETHGKRSQGKLSFFKNVAKAWRVDAIGKECVELEVEQGVIPITMRPGERSRVAIQWSP